MTLMHRLFFGESSFSEREELHEFKFKFLCLVMATSALFASGFLTLHGVGVVRLGVVHIAVLSSFALVSFLNWRVLIAKPSWFVAVAWTQELALAGVCISGLLFVPTDDLRVLWLFLNLSGVYMLLGSRAGFGVAAVSILSLWLVNAVMEAPYSRHGLITATVAMTYLALFFHALNGRLLAYFSRMQAYNATLQFQASHDPLTGVNNTHSYYAMGDHLLALGQRQHSPLAVLFVDLDHFKTVNDRYGHLAGDQVLQAVARCLQVRLRKSDVLGRIGGEEFSILLPQTECESALRVAEELRAAVEELRPEVTATVSGRTQLRIPVTASIGVACAHAGGQNFQIIQQQADEAMYAAKREGRNRVSLFEIPPADASADAPVPPKMAG